VKLFVALAGSLKRQHASKAAGFAAVAIVAAAFIGWWAGLPLLSSWGPPLSTLLVRCAQVARSLPETPALSVCRSRSTR